MFLFFPTIVIVHILFIFLVSWMDSQSMHSQSYIFLIAT